MGGLFAASMVVNQQIKDSMKHGALASDHIVQHGWAPKPKAPAGAWGPKPTATASTASNN